MIIVADQIALARGILVKIDLGVIELQFDIGIGIIVHAQHPLQGFAAVNTGVQIIQIQGAEPGGQFQSTQECFGFSIGPISPSSI